MGGDCEDVGVREDVVLLIVVEYYVLYVVFVGF